MHRPMPDGPIPDCPDCGEAMGWDSKWVQWICIPCDSQFDIDEELD